MQLRLRSLFCALVVCCGFAAFAQKVPIDVEFRLTDLDYKPIASAPVRVVFRSDAWELPTAGTRVVTDANGIARFSASAVIDKQMRKMPSNFVSNLVSVPQRADHLAVGAEMEWAGYRWLYVVDLFRFSGGDVMLDDYSIYSADEKGKFTRKAVREKDGLDIADLRPMMLTTEPFEPWQFLLTPPEAADGHWTLKLAFKKRPPPVRR